MNLTLLGEPKSTSHIYHYHCKFGRPSGYMTKDGIDLKESYALQARSQYRKKPLKGPLSLCAVLYFGTKREHDIDNYNKILFDSLTGVVWEDDVQVIEMNIRKAYDKENPRIELIVEPL